jgi:hypothetical protein
LIKLSAWRFDSFKKKPFELLDAPPKMDSVKVDSSKAAAHAIVSPAGTKMPSGGAKLPTTGVKAPAAAPTPKAKP